MIKWIAVALGCWGCASSSTQERPTQCSRADFHGTYLVSYAAQSGNCGSIATVLIDSQVAPTGCTLISQTWSDDECKVTGVNKCAEVQVTAIRSESAAGGAVYDGTATFESPQCVGTYAIHAVRQ